MILSPRQRRARRCTDHQGNFTAVVSFGDSLSDVGTYAPVTSLTGNGAPPYAGGRFTTNYVDATGKVVGTVGSSNVAEVAGPDHHAGDDGLGRKLG